MGWAIKIGGLCLIVFCMLVPAKPARADLLEDWHDVPVHKIILVRRNMMAVADAASTRWELEAEGKVKFVSCLRSLVRSVEFRNVLLGRALQICERLAR